jgi:hypothetical protein
VAAQVAPSVAEGQDFTAMINQQMAAMNNTIAQGQRQVDGIVQQRMQDPQVQAAYRQHVANASRHGVRHYDFPTFTYYYVYTNGFSAAGMAHARATDNGIRQAELNAWRGVQAAEANRGAAQSAWANGYFNNQQEAGRQLVGNSTFTATNGAQTVLPHTWQMNTVHQYQGNTYYVDYAGQYWVASSGHWYPLNRR